MQNYFVHFPLFICHICNKNDFYTAQISIKSICFPPIEKFHLITMNDYYIINYCSMNLHFSNEAQFWHFFYGVIETIQFLVSDFLVVIQFWIRNLFDNFFSLLYFYFSRGHEILVFFELVQKSIPWLYKIKF